MKEMPKPKFIDYIPLNEREEWRHKPLQEEKILPGQTLGSVKELLDALANLEKGIGSMRFKDE